MPVMHRIGSSHSAVFLLALVVLAGAWLVVRWLRTSRDGSTKGQRGRLQELAWCAALLVLALVVTRTLTPRTTYLLGMYNNWPWWIVALVGAAAIIIFWPWLAARIVPIALILYGLAGFVVARDYAYGGRVSSYGLTPVGTPGIRADLILPQAYALLLLGGWLTLRSADPVLVRMRQKLGPVDRAPLRHQLRTLALLPVVVILAAALAPRWWLGGGGALILTLALLFGVLLLIRRWPVRAGQLATAGLLCLGILGLGIAVAWDSAPATAPAPAATSGKIVFVAPATPGAVSSQAKPERVTTVPKPKPTAESSYAKPLRAPILVKANRFVPVPAPFVPTGADLTDVIWGRAVPFGAVLVADQRTADAAAVEGLAFLALGTWLAPQVFPFVRRMLGGVPDAELSRRVERLTESRAVAVDTASADLRRLERDLHDGAQARLVALGMSLRAAERLIPTSPDAAIALVAEAREASVKALTELRELVRGVLPPVLADRGLADAVRALALDSPLRVETEIDLAGRPPAPVETACYFAVAELLTNAAKHSGSRAARIAISHSGLLLRIEVTDFGLGGADPSLGSGLAGVEKRLASFDGILAVSSPPGGPTIVVLEVPCALSPLRASAR
jgi:signal transduction histidine kinase